MPHKISRRDLAKESAWKQKLESDLKQQKSLTRREQQIELVIRDFRKAENAKRRAERKQGPRYTFEQLELIKREGEKMIKERQLSAAKVSIESPLRYRRGCITELGICLTERGICRRTGDRVNWSGECADCGLSTEYDEGPVWCEDFEPMFCESKLSI